MEKCHGKLLELPRKGKAIVVTDLHGNLEDYKTYLSIWEESPPDTRLIITGDFIHGPKTCPDNSLQILDSIIDLSDERKDFHALLGNHELSHLNENPVYKDSINQKLEFENILHTKYGYWWTDVLEEFLDFFRKLPVAVKTANKVMISHSAPSRDVNNLDEIVNITNKGYYGNNRLWEFLWNRPEDYTSKDLNYFLKAVECEFSVVGHTPVDGFRVIYDKQLIISSSTDQRRKAYLELDLEKDIKNMGELVGMIKFIE